MTSGPLKGMNRQTIILIAVFLAVLFVSALASYLLFNRTSGPTTQGASVSQPAAAESSPAGTSATQPRRAADKDDSFLSRLIGSGESNPEETRAEHWLSTVARVTLRFALASLLTAMLAFRPRKRVPITMRNPYVAQTQILLAVVASALMMVVGDSAARAFGIFAAASLVRFRTNIRDPKEITVLLICLAVGLATGVGRWDLAIILSLFVLLTLWILEYYETGLVLRAMEIKVTTRNVAAAQEILRQIFEKHEFTAELRALDREDEEDPLGKIVYHVNISPSVSTDRLSEEIFASDENNIDAVEWNQKENISYIYK
ncbi:MAG TPA: DUF4956 domain-containing protein [Pyrinomonadaceae bacterium]|jgi:hypothetical protein